MPKRRRKRREDERENEEISEKRRDVADEFADRRWRWVVAGVAAARRVLCVRWSELLRVLNIRVGLGIVLT